MHYAIGTPDGQVHHIECDPFEIEAKIQAFGGGVLLTQADTLEVYERRRAEDKTGSFEWR